MTETTITTWAVTADRDGAPLILAAEPNAEEARTALALVRLNPEARRYSVEPVGVTDHGFAARLAREAIAGAFQGGADWTRVRPGDLAPPPSPPQPERRDPDAIRPGHPAWARLADETIKAGLTLYPEEDRPAARETLIARALAASWSLRELGRAILTERAEASEALGPIDPRHTIDQRDPLMPADPSEVWGRVTRAPKPGEVTNASRLAGGGF
jgi:hypothetical protein